jgi:hypothetical protein
LVDQNLNNLFIDPDGAACHQLDCLYQTVRGLGFEENARYAQLDYGGHIPRIRRFRNHQETALVTGMLRRGYEFGSAMRTSIRI